ncbi:MAG: ComEC/Rec2 family competence protein, partial [Flavobacteriales bacterium]
MKPEKHVFGLRSDENSILVIESFKSNASNWKSIVARDLETNERHLVRFQTEVELGERDTLVVNAKWKTIETVLVPGGFNPKEFYGKKGINKEAFVQNYVLIKGPTNSSIVKQLKEEFKTQLGKLAVEHQALCAGMILGDKTEIERQVLDQFRACGLMHVLAVSGMHVGLLASLPLLLLSFLPKNWIRLRFLLKLVSIVSVWGFAYFVGLGPSVVRSSIMFSAFLISSQRSHLTSKINLLCATAFTMLLVEPKWLFELGFQLSFVAVLGILLLGSMLTEVYSHFSWLVKKIFDVVNISVSAQLFTLPLAVYYFHEFPSYFLLGNLAIAPILVLSIYLCLLLILLNIVGCETSWLIGLIDQ